MRRVKGQQPSSSRSTAGSTRSIPCTWGAQCSKNVRTGLNCETWRNRPSGRDWRPREGEAHVQEDCFRWEEEVGRPRGGGQWEQGPAGAGAGRAPAVNTGVGAQRWGPIPRGWRGRLLGGNPKQLTSNLLLHFLGVFCVSGPVFDRHSSSVLLERGGDVTFKTLAIWGLSCGTEWLQSAGLSCSQSCGILVHWPGLKPHPLHCKANPQPLDHQGSPQECYWKKKKKQFICLCPLKRQTTWELCIKYYLGLKWGLQCSIQHLRCLWETDSNRQ